MSLKKSLSLALVAAALSSTAFAQEPVEAQPELSSLRQARGEYQLDDGRTLRVFVSDQRPHVRIDDQPGELWRAENENLLVSPDGQRRLHLIRDVNGSVNRIELRIAAAR